MELSTHSVCRIQGEEEPMMEASRRSFHRFIVSSLHCFISSSMSERSSAGESRVTCNEPRRDASSKTSAFCASHRLELTRTLSSLSDFVHFSC